MTSQSKHDLLLILRAPVLLLFEYFRVFAEERSLRFLGLGLRDRDKDRDKKW